MCVCVRERVSVNIIREEESPKEGMQTLLLILSWLSMHITTSPVTHFSKKPGRHALKEHDTPPEHAAAHNLGSPGHSVILTVFSEMSVSAATPGPTSSSVAVSLGVAVPYSSYAP